MLSKTTISVRSKSIRRHDSASGRLAYACARSSFISLCFPKVPFLGSGAEAKTHPEITRARSNESSMNPR
jgi:hypothetical protein